MVDDPRPGGGGRDGLPHDPVPGGSGPTRRPDRRLDPGNLVAEGTADELKRLVPGGHISLRFADASELDSAARALGEVDRDDDELTLQLPSDGGIRSLQALLHRLDAESIDVDELSVHTPDLDDVFLALTGHPDKEKEPVR